MTAPRLVLPLALCAILAAQESPPLDESVFHVDVNVVNVLCTVRDWQGLYVRDLRREDFRIREDGKPQEIRYFTRETRLPVTVALLVDVSGSVSRILSTEKAAASLFFAEVLRPRDQALVAAFSHIVSVGQALTSDLASIHRALRAIAPFDLNLRPELDPHGGTLLYEAVKQVCDRSLAGVSGRKAMVIVTDGLDNGSRVTAASAIQAAQRADTVVYAIHYQGDEPSAEGELALQRLSEPTGGRSFHVSALRPLDTIFDTIREEMRSQYAIGYVSTNRAHDGSYRRLSVKTTHRTLKVQARQGYYAPRAPAAR